MKQNKTNQSFCENCGTLLNKDVKFCHLCGHKVRCNLQENSPKRRIALKYKVIIALLLIGFISIYIMKTRQENYDDTMFVAHITNILIGSDGGQMLTGDECVEITKHFRMFAANKLHIDFDDVKTIMQVYKDEGGMANIRTSSQYKATLEQLIDLVYDLHMTFKQKEYAYLTKEVAMYQHLGFPLSEVKDTMLTLYFSAIESGVSYEKFKSLTFEKE